MLSFLHNTYSIGISELLYDSIVLKQGECLKKVDNQRRHPAGNVKANSFCYLSK